VATVFDGIDERQRDWIAAQAMFFVGTAPLAGDGHVNVSPKGPIGSLRVLDERTVAYLDIVGSGAETIAHLRENGRICLMFCSFDHRPRIVRLHGRGLVVTPGQQLYEEVVALHPAHPGTRAVIAVDVERVSDSCGYGVPMMDLTGERDLLRLNADKRGPDGMAAYRREKNALSIDGLPGL
jgi:hypothetical protein